MESLVFVATAAVLLIMAISVILAKSPLRSALALIVALSNLAVLFVLLEAPFVASMQVLVYAGAIMVLFLFVIMLLDLRPSAVVRAPNLALTTALGVLGSLYVLGRMLLGSLSARPLGSAALDGSVRHIGELLLSRYLFSFEAISVLLLVAVVGATALGLRRDA